jgi:Flp pilus assembly protein TadB
MTAHELLVCVAWMGIGMTGAGAVVLIVFYAVLPAWWRRHDRREKRRREERAEALLTRDRLGM